MADDATAEPTRVKICGIRRIEDAERAVALGAWALGFVFHRPSPRFIEPAAAAAISERVRGRALLAGVFVDWPLDDLQRAVEVAGLDAVQLHGSESESYAASVQANEVWKALRVSDGFDVDAVARFPSCDRVLLDTLRADAPGGTGRSFDWSIARQAGVRRPIILAGGIHAGNAAAAVRAARPWGIDVSSGVEDAPGVKNHRQLEALFDAIRNAAGG